MIHFKYKINQSELAFKLDRLQFGSRHGVVLTFRYSISEENHPTWRNLRERKCVKRLRCATYWNTIDEAVKKNSPAIALFKLEIPMSAWGLSFVFFVAFKPLAGALEAVLDIGALPAVDAGLGAIAEIG